MAAVAVTQRRQRPRGLIMPPVMTAFESTDFRPTNATLFKAFVVTRLNPTLNSGSVVSLETTDSRFEKGGDYILCKSGRRISEEKAHRLLWAGRAELPVRIVRGRRKGTIKLSAWGDSDNGTATYVPDDAIRQIARFIPGKTLVGFKSIQFPSNDTDDPGHASYWICRGKDVAARLSRDWSDGEVASGRFRLTSLATVVRVFRATSDFGLAERPAR